ncbi:MAG: amidohydrolase family protein [Pseudomonadota bacterium]
MKLRIRPLLLALLICSPFIAQSQETFTPNDVRDERRGAYALTNATIVPQPGEQLANATLLIEGGEIVALGAAVEVPDGYVVRDMGGHHLYPGLIDVHTGYGLEEPKAPPPFSFYAAEVVTPAREGAYNANDAIRADHRAAANFKVDAKKARELRALGVTSALTFLADGLARGTGALVLLGEGTANEMLLVPDAAAHYSFSKGSSAQSFPISAMGAVAALRQTYLDASWLESQNPAPFSDETLAAWTRLQSLPQVFSVNNWLSVLRADRLGDEFGVQYVIRGGGDEYRRLDAIKATGAPLILPLEFPEAPAVSDPLETRNVSWEDMAHWERAPGNAAALAGADVTFALTAWGNKKFMKNLRRAVTAGLSKDTALAALTTVPAALLKQEQRIGRLAPGALANVMVTTGPWLEKDSRLVATWVAGQEYPAAPAADHRGTYELTLGEASYTLELTGSPGKLQGKVTRTAPAASSDAPAGEAEADAGGQSAKANVVISDELITLAFRLDEPFRLSGWRSADGWRGEAQLADGSWTGFALTAQPGSGAAGDEAKPDTGKPDAAALAGDLRYPFSPYGWTERPEMENVVFRNAVVWTLTGDGRLDEADVHIRDGKIVAVGPDLSAAGAREIDASGRHLTPGIVDEHSHIALSAVNDIATNSGMVRMRDVVNSEDVSIYRNLAGGVTAAQLLHGSANPIGGQSALVKLRWGATPEEMLIEGADGFIKFALGENVKRSRNPNSIRYPQSRTGVEQVYRDGFAQARAYRETWDRYNALSRRQQRSSPAPRRDLALEPLAEILNQERFITCHSYVQSEISMLMNVADDFGFSVNTFTHILEGYKVADQMAAHGAGGSTFSDWWAYKWEVRYAIPYNAALMHQAGVVTAINSDSREMSRRLNQEAAKAVKYGQMSEVEALKTVTLNPAKLLHLDDRMGSIEVGKDADLVLWSHHPLSIDAQAEQTLVDGRVLFDRARDARLRDELRADRARLTSRLLKEKPAGGGAPGSSAKPEFHCDSLTGFEHLTALREAHH